MTMSVERGLGGLAAYAQDVLNDSDKAQRVREKLQEVKDFLANEGLTAVSSTRTELDRARKARSETRYEQLQNHLATVAQEALQVENGQLVHQTRMDVARRLRERMSEGDPRLLSHYTDATLAHHVFNSGIAVTLGGVFRSYRGFHDIKLVRTPLVSAVTSPNFETIVTNNAWRETLVHASRVLPEGADGFDLGFLLMHFQHLGKLRDISKVFETVQQVRRPHNAA